MRRVHTCLGLASVSDAAPSSLRLDTVTRPDHSVILVHGDVDSSTAPQLAAVLESLVDDVRRIEIDMGELRFLDSTGIGVLATCLSRLEDLDGTLELSNVPPMVMRLLGITDLLRFVTVLSELDK